MAKYYRDVDRKNKADSDHRSYPLGGLSHPAPHHGHVPEYQQSCIPFCSASINPDGPDEYELTFPYVTRFINVTAHGAQLSVSFASGQHGTGTTSSNHFEIPADTSTGRLEIKCTAIRLKGSSTGAGKGWSVIAGLTNVPSGSFPDISDLAGISGGEANNG